MVRGYTYTVATAHFFFFWLIATAHWKHKSNAAPIVQMLTGATLNTFIEAVVVSSCLLNFPRQNSNWI
jgi:hypothetical protein